MKRKTYKDVCLIFKKQDCELLEKKYKNNSTKMMFKCKCKRISEITLNQFQKNPQCNKCGIQQMKKSKDKGQQPCRACESMSDLMNRKKYGNICRSCYNNIHAEFQKKHAKDYYLKHKSKRDEYNKKRRTENSEIVNYISNKSYHKTRIEVLAHYSPDLRCIECGFDKHTSALSIDHINGDGCSHRKEIGGQNMYYWIKQNNFPNNLQVLCMNCQFIKRYENNECLKK